MYAYMHAYLRECVYMCMPVYVHILLKFYFIFTLSLIHVGHWGRTFAALTFSPGASSNTALSRLKHDPTNSSASRVAIYYKVINKPQKSRISSPTRPLMTKWRKTATINNEWSIRRNMQNHQLEIQARGHQEIQPRDHTRNDHGIKEPEESPKNAEARP